MIVEGRRFDIRSPNEYAKAMAVFASLDLNEKKE